MATKRLQANIIAQTSGGKYQTFSNLNNIKKDAATYAETATIGGKSKPLNRPSALRIYKFKAGVPTGSLITKIEVRYIHSKVAASGNKTPNITAPTITLMNGTSAMKWSDGKNMAKKGQAPTTLTPINKVIFTGRWNYDIINNDNFGVRIDYPTNANENEGKLRVHYVNIVITYRTPNFGVNISRESGEYNGDTFTFFVTASNINNVKYTPDVTITVPVGFSLHDYTSYGKLVKVNAVTYLWTPKLGEGKGSDTLIVRFDVNLTYASGVEVKSCTLEAIENLQQHSKTLTFNVTKTRPIDPKVDPETDGEKNIQDDDLKPEAPKIAHVATGERFNLDFQFTQEEVNSFQSVYGGRRVFYISVYNNPDFAIDDFSQETEISYDMVYLTSLNDDYSYEKQYYSNVVGQRTIIVWQGTIGTSTVVRRLDYDVYPSSITTPFASVLTLSNEEVNRLGDGYTYTAETMLKDITSDSFVKDWPKNFKIGVFNNAIEDDIHNIVVDGEEILIDSTNYDSLTLEEIVANAEFWSDAPDTPNVYTNLECEFRYNDDYPLYIVVTGDYPEASTPADVAFTEPVIVETQYYEERTSNGVYPVPIDDLVLNDGSTSEIQINQLANSDKVVFYDLPLEDDFGTDDEIAIRGLALNGTVEQNTDNLILSASLVNSKNEAKNRSIVLDETDATLNADNEFTIGQVGDLWGFSTNDIKELEDWEIHLSLNNAPNEYSASANFGNINLTVYYEQIEHQKIQCYIEGEDLSYYGIFIRDVKIPEGLKTDTDYINVAGTDVNNPYRQNIREKTIEVEFDIGDNCDLEAATLSLRQLTKLLVNERDEYNKPIPKRIEFSHYQDVYWEYIMEDTLSNEVEISSYTGKAKLVIPAGTSYDKKTTITNTTGYLSGLASVRPLIIFKPTGDLITIRETLSNQEFNMTYKDDSWAGKYIEIDCDNRIVLLKEDDDDDDGINITSYVDWNSDWFTLYGEYNFEAIDCAILSVKWEERW